MSDLVYLVKEVAAASWVAIKRNKWGLAKLAVAFVLGAWVF